MADSTFPVPPEALLSHGDFVRSLARCLIDDEHRAEDITQETLLAALRNIPAGLGRGRIRAWLAAVCRNLARKTYRDETRQVRKQAAAARPEAPRSTAEIVAREAVRRRVIEAVLGLKEPYRSAILYRFYDDLPPRKIAEQLDLPVETVTTRIQRGLKQLRTRLDSLYEGNRKTWCMALAPLAGLAVLPTAAASMAALTGVIAMSTKIKIAAVSAVLVLGTAFIVLWQAPDDRELPEAFLDPDPLVSAGSQADPVQSTIAGDHDSGSPGREDRGNLTPSGDSRFFVAGRAVLQGGGALPADLAVTCLPQPPPFSRVPIGQRNEVVAAAAETLNLPRALADPMGRFRLEGLPDRKLYLYPLHPFLRCVKTRAVRPEPAGEAGSPAAEVLLVLEAGGVIEGVVLRPDGRPAKNVAVTLRDEDIPFSLIGSSTARREGVTTNTVTTTAEGKFRFEQVPANRKMVLGAVVEGFAPSWVQSVVARANRSLYVPLLLTPPGLISGRVEDAEGRPYPGVNVRLLKGRIDLAVAFLLEGEECRTDARGGFAFHDLPPLEYILMLEAPGCLQQVPGEIPLAAGEQVTDLRLVLRSGRAICGTVTDGEGNPVPDVFVEPGLSLTLGQMTSFTSDRIREASTRTDVAGRFGIYGLRDGEYDLSLTAEAWAPTRVEGVAAGTEDLSVVLRRGGEIAGIALSSLTNEAVDDYQLILQPRPEGGFSMLNLFGGRDRQRHPIKDPHGRFRLTNLTPGTYDLTFEARGLAPRELKGIVVAEDAPVRGIMAVLPPEASLAGIVLDKETRRPLEGINISQKAFGFEGRFHKILGKPTEFTDATGKFHFGGLAAGKVRLVFAHDRYLEQRLEPLTLLEGESIENLEILLSRGATIRGTVSDGLGSPVSEARVVVTDATGALARPGISNEEGIYEVTGLAGGSYSVLLLPPKLTIGSKDFLKELMQNQRLQQVSLKKDQVLTCDFTLGAEDTAGSLLRGRVLERGQPVAQAILVLQEEGRSVEQSRPHLTVSDAEGAYSLSGLTPGSYRLHVSRMVGIGSTAGLHSVTVGAGPVTEYDVHLASGRISGRVRDHRSLKPLDRIRVVLVKGESPLRGDRYQDALESRAGEVYTDKQGRFDLANLPAGRYTLRVGGGGLLGMDSGGYALQVVSPIEISEDTHRDDLSLGLRPGGNLRGVVVDAQDRPLAGAMVFVEDSRAEGLGLWTDCYSDSEGGFLYVGLNPGQCTVRVQGPEEREPVEHIVWIEAGRTAVLPVKLP